MVVTGVQAVGAKGVTAIQGAVVDPKDATRLGSDGRRDGDRAGGAPKAGEPQPVVFPRKGVPMDHRPVSLREHRAALRYRQDGGQPQHDDDAA
jgi:hypothetical protein